MPVNLPTGRSGAIGAAQAQPSDSNALQFGAAWVPDAAAIDNTKAKIADRRMSVSPFMAATSSL
jgi:hypothetical protein